MNSSLPQFSHFSAGRVRNGSILGKRGRLECTPLPCPYLPRRGACSLRHLLAIPILESVLAHGLRGRRTRGWPRVNSTGGDA